MTKSPVLSCYIQIFAGPSIRMVISVTANLAGFRDKGPKGIVVLWTGSKSGASSGDVHLALVPVFHCESE